MPQEMFVIGDEDEDAATTPTNAAGGETKSAVVENSMQPMQLSKPTPMIKPVKREPVYVAEKNRSKIDSFTAAGDLYQAFEAGIPLRLIEYREFEGRVKKLVYGRTTATIRQL